MKYLVYIILFFSINSYSQSKIIITRSPSSTIYVGIINYALIKTKAKNYYVKGENLIIYPQKSDTLKITANKQGQGVLFLYEIVKEDTLLVEKKRINIENIPNGEVAIGKSILKNGISKQNFLNAKTLDILFDVDYSGASKWMIVSSYEIIIENRKIKCLSNNIPNIAKELVRRKVGSINITIENIMVQRPEKVIVPFGDIKFNIY